MFKTCLSPREGRHGERQAVLDYREEDFGSPGDYIELTVVYQVDPLQAATKRYISGGKLKGLAERHSTSIKVTLSQSPLTSYGFAGR